MKPITEMSSKPSNTFYNSTQNQLMKKKSRVTGSPKKSIELKQSNKKNKEFNELIKRQD